MPKMDFDSTVWRMLQLSSIVVASMQPAVFVQWFARQIRRFPTHQHRPGEGGESERLKLHEKNPSV